MSGQGSPSARCSPWPHAALGPPPIPLPPGPCSKTNAELVKYQGCEHTQQHYIDNLQPYKKSLPKSILRDFKC